MTGRFDRAGNSVANALRALSSVGDPGHASPGEIAAGLAAVLRARLGPLERMTVAGAAMLSLDIEDAERLAETALADLRRGQPVPAFAGVREEARLWAQWASPAECRAYMAACWNQLPETDHATFLRATKRRAS